MHKIILYQGRQLAYTISGGGPTVVLLHGFGEDARVWDFQKDYLEQHFEILIPDIAGSGQSQMIDDMSMEGLAESIHFILENESIKKCVMIGHSMGGYITLAFAEKYSALLAGFGLFHSTAFADSDEKKATRQKAIQFIENNGPLAFLKSSVPTLYSPATKQKAPSLIEEQLQAVHNSTAAALTAYYQAMINRPDRTHILKTTPLPVLIVLGRWDEAVPLADGLPLCSMADLSYIHILEESGHMGMQEEPEKSNALLNHFLSVTLQPTH